ncbi:DUF2798 domain-containing protein [Pseudooceanicola sp. C21-150M6]|uniref:DUF2798 domain-containing protein n=1 Tax=Pseudooceanicola sp. C21-150M6 TaxID=3434355 RepID=UPI003D7F86E8
MRRRLIFAVLLSSMLSFLMTLWICWLTLGFGPQFLGQWMHAYVVAWPSAALISFALGPVVLRWTAAIEARLDGIELARQS